MDVGLAIFATDRSISIVELARAAEARGFRSLYVPEHTHIPTSRTTPPPTGDAELAEEYTRTLDPFTALCAAAAVTTDLRVGTGVALVAQHDPIVLAKAVATIDLISNGRMVLGVGFGWNEDEMAHHGVPYDQRRAIAREKVLAMQALWADDVAEFHGEHVQFAPSWSWPKPVQRPRVPVLLGGAPGPKLFAHIAEYGDGWIPIGGGGVKAAIPDMHRAAEQAGRDPATLRVLPFGVVPDPGKLDYYESIGVTEVALRLPSAPSDVVLRKLDEYVDALGWG
jgi:probable F420-dependent oxidoreductase